MLEKVKEEQVTERQDLVAAQKTHKSPFDDHMMMSARDFSRTEDMTMGKNRDTKR